MVLEFHLNRYLHLCGYLNLFFLFFAGCKECWPLDCFKVENQCYYFGCGMRNWYEARNFCKNKSAAMLLPNFTNDNSIRGLLKKRNGQTCREIWVAYHQEDWINVQSIIYLFVK